MSSTAVLREVEDRISAGDSPDELVSVLAQRHGLTADESSAVWLSPTGKPRTLAIGAGRYERGRY